MKAKGITSVELAGRVGVSKTMVSYWLSGKNFPTPENIEAIAKALGVEPWELLVSREQLANYKSDSLMTQCPHCGKPITIKATIE